MGGPDTNVYPLEGANTNDVPKLTVEINYTLLDP